MPTYNECVNLIDGNLASNSDIKAIEHRQVEKAILDYCRERMDGFDNTQTEGAVVVADISLQLADHHDEYPSGNGLNFGSAELLNSLVNDSRYKVTFANPISGNFFVVLTNESIGSSSSSWDNDNDIILTYKNADQNGLEVILREVGPSVQNLRVHITIINY